MIKGTLSAGLGGLQLNNTSYTSMENALNPKPCVRADENGPTTTCTLKPKP